MNNKINQAAVRTQERSVHQKLKNKHFVYFSLGWNVCHALKFDKIDIGVSKRFQTHVLSTFME